MENLNECVDEEEEEGGSRALLLPVSSGPSMKWQLSIVHTYRATFAKALENMETLAPGEVW